MSQLREYRATEVPRNIRSQVINAFYVEFLNYGGVISTGNEAQDAEREHKKKNHVTIRVNFANPVQGNLLGARISMDVVFDSVGSNEAIYAGSSGSETSASGTKDGQMNVKLIRYTGPSHAAIQTFEFPVLRNNITLGQLIDLALQRRIHLFKFLTVHGLAYMGCRDFIIQYFHHIQSAGIVRSTVRGGSNRTLNDIIAWRYSPTEVGSDTSADIRSGAAVRATPSPVEQGWFAAYNRVLVRGMQYRPS